MGWGAPTWEKKKKKGKEGRAASLVPALGLGLLEPWWGFRAPSGKAEPTGAPGASATCPELLGPTLCSVSLPGTCFSAWLCPEVTVTLLPQAGSFQGGGWCLLLPSKAALMGVLGQGWPLKDAATLQAVALLLLPWVGGEPLASVSPQILTF